MSKKYSVDELVEMLTDLDVVSENLAKKVAEQASKIAWDINEEDVPIAIDCLRNKVDFAKVDKIIYDETEFTDWLENDQDKYDGGYQVISGKETRYFAWNYGGDKVTELYIIKKPTFTTKKPKKVNESVEGVTAELDLLKSAVAHGDLSAYEAVDSAFKLGHGSRMPDEEEVIDIIDGLMDDEIDVDEAIDVAYERGWDAINQACAFS